MPPPQHAPKRRLPRLRAAALCAAVVLSVALPLTSAGAGPLAAPGTGPRPEAPGAAGVESADGRPPGVLHGPLKPRDPVPGDRLPQPDEDAASPRAEEPGAAGHAGPSAVCGPRVDVPGRVTGQTCVLEEEDLTWGRTYYRNTSGAPLIGVLTLMRPDGRTLQVHCDLPPTGNPETCETPRERTVHPLEHEEPYMAVAEIATADAERMLLRAGSNTASGQER